MTNFNITEYVNYFQQAAVNNKLLLHVVGDKANKHFFNLDIEEVLGGQRFEFKNYALVLEDVDGGFADALSDNIREVPNCAFSIIKQFDVKMGSHTDKVTLLSDSLVIGKQIVTKLRKDRMNRVLSHLDMNSFRYHKIGPVMGSAYGYRFTFNFDQPAFLKFEPSQWNNETPLSI